ncbi:MAG: DUF4912 domain-containing protein [Moorella humiferrea]|nr:DUF4912 domain-containing protein [Moorella humiferrea]
MGGGAFGRAANELVCLLQDPRTLFVYWAFSPERMQVVRDFLDKFHPASPLVLRLVCKASPLHSREITLTFRPSGSHYFRDVDPSFAYHVELGLKTPRGQFLVLARTPGIIPGPFWAGQKAGEEAGAVKADKADKGGKELRNFISHRS